MKISRNLAEKYLRERYPNAKVIDNPHFSYADLGNNYSYAKFHATIDGEWAEHNLDMTEFFEWLGSKMT